MGVTLRYLRHVGQNESHSPARLHQRAPMTERQELLENDGIDLVAHGADEAEIAREVCAGEYPDRP